MTSSPEPIREPLQLECYDCFHVTEISVEQQEKILANLGRLPAQVHIITCSACHRYQFSIGKRARREVTQQ